MLWMIQNLSWRYKIRILRLKWKIIFILLTVLSINLLAGCSPDTDNGTNNNAKTEVGEKEGEKTVNIVYVDWESETASAHVVKAVIEEKLGYQCELLEVSAIAMWESIAASEQDGMVAAWLPYLHQDYYKEHQDQIIDLGPNLEGAETGLVVPDYVPIDSIEELNEYANDFDHKIIGIDPEAGIMSATETVLEEYDLEDFELVTGSDYTMTTTLEGAIEEGRWIVVTGWTPHWKFAQWDLKYLEDPRGVFGEEEYISTMVRKGLKEDMPDVYSFLDNFNWTSEDMGEVMLWFQEADTSPEEAANRWIEKNKETVSGWIN